MVFRCFVFWRKFKKNMLSDDLEKTINRAVSYANDRQQEYVTLEHLLLALLDDKDALGVLNACNTLRFCEILLFLFNSLVNLIFIP